MESVELRLKKTMLIYSGIVGIGPFLFFILFSIYLKMFQDDILLTRNLFILMIICLLISIGGVFFYLPNIRFNIEKSGISVSRKLEIRHFTLFESHQKFEWNSIKSFEFRSWLGIFYGGYWCLDDNNDFILIRWRLTNYRKAVEIIAETLSQMGTAKIDPKIIRKIKQWSARGLL